MVSEGVTAMMASNTPAPRPASSDRGAVSLPYTMLSATSTCRPTHILILEHRFELVISRESDSSFRGISNDHHAAARIEPSETALAKRLAESSVWRQRL